jgi:hypothetical protein
MENGSRGRTLAVLVAALGFVAAGCGDDDDDDAGGDDVAVSEPGSEATEAPGASATTAAPATTAGPRSPDAQAYVDAMIRSFDNSAPEELQINRGQAQCLAPLWVEAIGPDRLAEAGVAPRDFAADDDVDLSVVGLTEEDGGEMYDAFAACDVDVKRLFVQSMATEQQLSAEDEACLEGAFAEDLLRRIMITTFVEGEDALDQDQELRGEMFAVFADCPGLVPED